MNALNILSGLSSTPPASPPRSRTSSSANLLNATSQPDAALKREGSDSSDETLSDDFHASCERTSGQEDRPADLDEKTPLLEQALHGGAETSPSATSWQLPRRIANAIVSSIEAVFGAITAPGRYLVACFYDERGNFSAFLPIRKLDSLVRRRKRRRSTAHSMGSRSGSVDGRDGLDKPKLRPKDAEKQPKDGEAVGYSTGIARSDSDTEKSSTGDTDDNPARNTRSRTAARDEIAPAKKSIRIKLHNEAALNKQRRHRAQLSVDGSKLEDDSVAAVANSLKSPSSPAVKLRYPRAPVPPRPLVPRRQPSYAPTFNPDAPKKTLVIDLDETLIHSMAKGGRMSTGHMVEVKFQGPIGGGGIVLGPQVPILYYVHERPHCHEFLRKVSPPWHFRRHS